jgi:hypothetical protein
MPICRIFAPSIVKLVLLVPGSSLEASLANVSASSFPAMSVCPGTQFRVIVAPLPTMHLVAWIARIWQAWPGLSDGVFKRSRPAWLSK